MLFKYFFYSNTYFIQILIIFQYLFYSLFKYLFYSNTYLLFKYLFIIQILILFKYLFYSNTYFIQILILFKYLFIQILFKYKYFFYSNTYFFSYYIREKTLISISKRLKDMTLIFICYSNNYFIYFSNIYLFFK